MSLILKKQQSAFLEAADSIINQRRAPDYVSGSDERRAGIICDKLAQSWHGELILNWAKEHEVSILFDHQAEGVGGYYMIGLNCVILNAQHNNNKLAATLAHELRHAWQDHQNLLKSIDQHKDVADCIRHAKVVEADAFAYGYICSYEMFGARDSAILDYRSASYSEAIENALAEDPEALKNGKAYAAAYTALSDLPQLHDFYNEFCAKNYAKHHEIGNYTLPDVDTIGKYMPYFTFPSRPGRDIEDVEAQKQLSNVFHKYHYLPYLQETYGNIAHNKALNGGLDSKTRNIVKHIRKEARRKQQHKKLVRKIMRGL